MTTPESLAAVVLLAVLAGSLLGSVRAFMFAGANAAEDLRSQGPQFRADWRPEQRHQGAPQTYSVSHPESAPRRCFGLLSLLSVFALAYGVSTAAFFSYNSPWSTETDLRHLAAGVHCELARQAGLAPARLGQPGYHARLDTDANGVSCEAPPVPGIVLTAGPDTRLSTIALGWPAASTATQ